MKTMSVAKLGKTIFSVLSAGCIAIALSTAAMAATEGCDPRVKEAADAKAEAMRAYHMAVVKELVEMPDSVLALTCFAQHANNSSTSPDSFSGVFPEEVAKTVDDTLAGWYAANFTGDNHWRGPLGRVSGEVDYATDSVVAATGRNCTSIKDLWDEVKAQPIKRAEGNNARVPYMTMDELMNKQIPNGAGDHFRKSLMGKNGSGGDQAVLDNFKTKYEDLPPPAAVPPLGNNNTVCDVLTGVGSQC